MLIVSHLFGFVGLLFWLWGTLPILNQKHSVFYKLHTLTVSDSVGSLLILMALLFRSTKYWPLILLTAISLSLWNTIFSYIIANTSGRAS